MFLPSKNASRFPDHQTLTSWCCCCCHREEGKPALPARKTFTSRKCENSKFRLNSEEEGIICLRALASIQPRTDGQNVVPSASNTILFGILIWSYLAPTQRAPRLARFRSTSAARRSPRPATSAPDLDRVIRGELMTLGVCGRVVGWLYFFYNVLVSIQFCSYNLCEYF